MDYDVTIIDVGDADAIVINYLYGLQWRTAVIDAGNVTDGHKVKDYVKHKVNNTCIIDYAFCTHPDKDHKGGFFELFDDPEVQIKNFVYADPVKSVENDYRRLLFETGNLVQEAKKIYNHPTNNHLNLIDVARHHHTNIIDGWNLGTDFPDIPICIVGPTKEFFKEAAYDMALHFSELEDEANAQPYDEDEIMDDADACSVMDTEPEPSATNKASLIILFHPEGRKFLLAGDACAKSIHDAVDCFGDNITNCVLKVPHHGSKHNLTTEVIDLLHPESAVISCRGSRKHPNSGVVYWLSKYCDVFSTAKSGSLIYQKAPANNPAIPLKRKQ